MRISQILRRFLKLIERYPKSAVLAAGTLFGTAVWFRRTKGKPPIKVHEPPILESPRRHLDFRELKGVHREAKTEILIESSPNEVRSFLQFPGRHGETVTDLCIGFDFGTSCSKVIVQSPYMLGGRSFAVRFGASMTTGSQFLIPTQLFINSEGVISLGAGEEREKRRSDLKMALMQIGGESDLEGITIEIAMAWAAAYIGLALREARKFVVYTQGENYGHQRIRWALNLGIPSAGYDDEPIRERFTVVARASWQISLMSEPLSIERAAAAVSEARQHSLHGVEISVVPEVAAEVVGYARSRAREEGLHVILDMGASTLDLCAFILHREDEDDRYSMLTADLQRLGLLELHRRRMGAAEDRPPFDRMPEDLTIALPNWRGIQWNDDRLDTKLKETDANYAEDCGRMILKTILDLKRKRDPNSPRWVEGLPIFVCGGGARGRITEEAIHFAEFTGKKYLNPFRGVRVMHLHTPPSLELGGAGVDFTRLAVAYGLSYPAMDIGTIEPPGSIEDLRKIVQPWSPEERYIGPEQV